MLFVRIMGGIGNQLFQYAFAEFLRQMGKRDIVLEFGFYDYIQKPGIDPIRENMLDRFSLPYLKVEGDIHPKYIITEENLGEGLKLDDDAIFIGLWQDKDIAGYASGYIRERFRLKEEYLTRDIRKLADEMSAGFSVSLHVRRTDYLSPENANVYVRLDRQYYERAAEHIINNCDGNPVFYIFSDDPDWAEDNLSGIKGCETRIIKGNEAYQDLYLMTKCRNSIIANSTFSWWGAFLRDDINGMTVVPARWFLDREDYDLYFDDYIRIMP